MKEIDTMKTLTYAWRFLARSKAYTIINILGLSFSLACLPDFNEVYPSGTDG